MPTFIVDARQWTTYPFTLTKLSTDTSTAPFIPFSKYPVPKEGDQIPTWGNKTFSYFNRVTGSEMNTVTEWQMGGLTLTITQKTDKALATCALTGGNARLYSCFNQGSLDGGNSFMITNR
ncbi:hypothetical protein [Streptomyces sp. WAC06614]|uniref:hypothetical protein n=1 Tax=Streptomyces sp. WAC06614 TaxID=2487416 RepID=UPI000F7B9847|nr:hypothetical protein [Streptomyces sp. WAC06614]